MGKEKEKTTKTFDFIANERQVLRWWYQRGVVQRYLHRNDRAKKKFSFFDGPITANNPMGVHHAWGRTLKDLYQRYKNMQGYRQRFQNGFDCQGLWVEVEVEKEKGFHNKQDIEKYGIARFVRACQQRVKQYAQIQTKQSIRLGYFMDWDNSYYTMSPENNYMIWYFLKKLWQEGAIYQGKDAVPWCPRCGTAISQHEMETEGYRQITHQAVYLRLPLHRQGKWIKDEFLLVWTTTPWTIPANTLVAFNPEITYGLVKLAGKSYWLAQKLIAKVFGRELKPERLLPGKELLTTARIDAYRAPFDDLPRIKKLLDQPHFHRLVPAPDLVNEKEGTGLVHIVPGAGSDDYRLVHKDLGWDEIIFPVIDEAANYLEGYGFLSGQNAKKNPNLVLDYLRQKKATYLFKIEPYRHAYPTCWRCGSELVWRLVDEWYINMDKPRPGDGLTLRQRMIKVAKQIHWLPEFGLKRELDWLRNMHDWLISKKRYWGLSLPIWQCSHCGHFEVIGSREELKKKAVVGWDKFAGHTPHRPWIDAVKIRCPRCGHLMSRVKDVGNPWLDAGIIPFSTLIDPETKKVSYLTNKKYWREWFPADFITECFPGQFRNWFYALIAMATELEDRPPTRTILGHALVRDEKGEEMHKSRGNAIWFDEAAEKMGVDVMRWLYSRQKPEFNLNFGYRIAAEVRRQYLLPYWNSVRFYLTYRNLNKFTPADLAVLPEPVELSILDRWALSRLEHLKIKVKTSLERYQHQEAVWALEEFIADLSNWYIRRSRERVNPWLSRPEERRQSLAVLDYLLHQLSLLLAPIIPFLSETVWQWLAGRQRLSQWRPADSIHLQNWPKVRRKWCDGKLEKQMVLVREIVSQGHRQRKLKGLRVRQPLAAVRIKNIPITLAAAWQQLISAELNVKRVVSQSGRGELKVSLEEKISPALAREGKARDLIHQIQILRRQQGLKPGEKITIIAPDWPEEWQDEILRRTNARAIRSGQQLAIIRGK